MTDLITKEKLIEAILSLRDKGWIPTHRPGNQGGVGNTLEDLLGLHENNLPIPNAAEWEIKSQRSNTNSLTTLFHMEPSPRTIRWVPNILLPKYGWTHKLADSKYSSHEKSFRQTINGLSASDRGFKIEVDDVNRRVVLSFDSSSIADRHSEWRETLRKTVGLNQLDPQPYWGIDDLGHKAGTKLINTFYVVADSMIIDGVEHFYYKKLMLLSGFNVDRFIKAIKEGKIYVDFDARTGHNHGTKFRLRSNTLPDLYSKVQDFG